MNEEFLNGLGLDKETSDLIMQQYDAEKLQEGISFELKNAGTVDETAARTMLEREDLTLDNIREKVGELKEKHPTLFKSSQPRIVSYAEKKAAVDRSQFSQMSYRERLELFKKSPDTYKRLVE